VNLSNKKNQEGLPEHSVQTHGLLLNWLAPVYDRICSTFGLGQVFRDTTLRYVALKPGEHILDVGCGTGVLTRLAAEVVGEKGKAVGIDPAPKMISIAIENAAIERSQAEFRVAVIENLPFENDSFDCVLSSFMIHHLPPDLKLTGLTEVYRVLKPGGRLLAVDIYRPTNPLWWLIVWVLYLTKFTRDHIAGRLPSYFKKAGFHQVETVGHWNGILTFWLSHKPK
jgi:ubiquinone/menaquinone biosynthesis C-methylase UbiE